VFHFAVPFVILLLRRVKREATDLVRLAVGILVMRLVDLFWLIAPDFHRGGISVSWLDILLPASLAATWLAAVVWQLRGRAILPVHDPEFDETLGPIVGQSDQRPGLAH